jgi:hypothetical protein
MTRDPTALFDPAPLSEHDQRLIDLYLRSGRAVDELAYTDEFDVIFGELQAAGDPRTKAEVFRRLLNLRKAGRLPRIA